MNRPLRWSVLTACAAVLAAACWNPRVTNGGFVCAPSDNPPCPSGFFCVNARCVEQPGDAGADLASPSSVDMAGADLATQSTPDLASSDEDMKACRPKGSMCHSTVDCCSGMCAFVICL
jgi:hypothetical protein